MDKIKTILSTIWTYIKAAGSFVYQEFRQYPQYGWPTVTFIAGYLIGKLV